MLTDLQDKITKLIALYEGEKQRADMLAEDLAKREETVAALKKQIAELNRQTDNQRLLSAFTSEGRNPVARERLNKLIREIDKCISLLEQ